MTPPLVRLRLLAARQRELRRIIADAQNDRPNDMAAFVGSYLICDGLTDDIGGRPA